MANNIEDQLRFIAGLLSHHRWRNQTSKIPTSVYMFYSLPQETLQVRPSDITMRFIYGAHRLAGCPTLLRKRVLQPLRKRADFPPKLVKARSSAAVKKRADKNRCVTTCEVVLEYVVMRQLYTSQGVTLLYKTK